ncbi:hypothetical protein H6G81_34425 [Scytonema hofmannii FACHB-248]|uniref:Uncharacterized protein n=1 Tax=Scytonema hofmannii FACHB-248 TaxID=1842502 RepID=A0ABR8H0V4_9CYAN|nr:MULTISPECIES: hypothetical protein [Nostocales]MBD2609452.1 hypothetical protein [Scytonema hofmannii FACHB-248]
MRIVELDAVFVVNGRLAIKLITFARLLHYSNDYLLQMIKKLLKKGIRIGFKWKRNWYIFLPSTSIKKIVQNKNGGGSSGSGNGDNDSATTPSGDSIETDWDTAIEELPPAIVDSLERTNFNVVTVNNRLVIPISSTQQLSSTLIPKRGLEFIPPNLGSFPATTDYRYGYYIFYTEDSMSSFDPGTSGTLKSTQIPAAFFEVCRALDAAENLRNGSNPGLPPRRNLSTTVSFDTGTISVAATIPVTVSIETDGAIQIVASDYLGSTYSAFLNGGGDLLSNTLPEALLEISSILAAAEKTVVPTENQPNNVQIQFDNETGSATISANLPFSTMAATSGDVSIHAIDYL